MPGPQNARSNVSGSEPVSLAVGEIKINQADDVIYTQKPDGTYRRFLLSKRTGIADVGYTVKRWDTYVAFKTLTSPRTLQLPAAAAYPVGHPLEIADESGNCSTTNQITILPAGSDTINGAVSLPMTAANFGARLFSDGVSNWVSPQYTANNSAALAAAVTAAQNAQTAAQTAAALNGQCRMTFVSSTQLQLAREAGTLMFVNGVARTIPAAGVTVDNTGLLGSTLYHVYAYMNGANLALEVVATASAVDPTYGHRVKSGDSSRTLVGIVYTAGASNAAGTYQGGLGTLSWHNRRDMEVGTGVVQPQTASQPFVTLTGTTLQGLCWADEAIDYEVTGYGGLGNVSAGYYANLRAVLGDAGFATPSIIGPAARAGGQGYISGGVPSRVFTRPGVTSVVGAWAQGAVDQGATTATYNISGIMKTRG